MRRKVVQRKLKSVLRGYSQVEYLVRKATCSDPWGPSSTQLCHVAQCASSEREIGQVMRVLWKRLLAGRRNWLYVYKALIVLEYLLKFGVKFVVEQCRRSHVYLSSFLYFNSINPNATPSQVSLIHDRAQSILDLLGNPQYLLEQQNKLRHIMGNLHGNVDVMEVSQTHPGLWSPVKRSVSLDPFGQSRPTATHRSSPHDPREGCLANQHQPEEDELDLQLRLATALSLTEHNRKQLQPQQNHGEQQTQWQQFDVNDSVGPDNRNMHRFSRQLDALALDFDAQHFSPTGSVRSRSISQLDEWIREDMNHAESQNLDRWSSCSDTTDHPTPTHKMPQVTGGSRTVYEDLASVDFTIKPESADTSAFSPSLTTQLTTPSHSTVQETQDAENQSAVQNQKPDSRQAAQFLGEFSKLVDLDNLMHPQFRLRHCFNDGKMVSKPSLLSTQNSGAEVGPKFKTALIPVDPNIQQQSLDHGLSHPHRFYDVANKSFARPTLLASIAPISASATQQSFHTWNTSNMCNPGTVTDRPDSLAPYPSFSYASNPNIVTRSATQSASNNPFL